MSVIVPLRNPDNATLLEEILAVRADGDVPLVGDSRWASDHWDVLARAATDAPVPAGTAWAAFTSGSTGSPRIVVRTADSWEASFAPLWALLDLTPADTVYLPVPPASSLTLFGIAHAASVGAAISLSSGSSVRAADLADATVLHGTPQALAATLDALEKAPGSSLLRVALVGGSALDPSLRDRAGTLGISVIAYYGAAELSFVAIDSGEGLRPFDAVDLDVREGELWVRSPYLASGYLDLGASAPGAPASGAPVPGAPVPAAGSGAFRREGAWATVGDRAEISGGYLRLRGRRDGAILTASATVIPEDVESVLRTRPDVFEVLVFGMPHATLGSHVAAVIEPRPGHPAPSLAELRALAASALPVSHRPRRWFTVEHMPRTASGKPARADLIARVSSGEVRALE